MGTVVKGLLRSKWQSQLQFVRYRSKINITKPRPPHYERALLETVCLPYFTVKKRPQHIPDYDACDSFAVKEKPALADHPLKAILIKEHLNWFQNSKLIAFFHLNSLNPEEKFEYELLLKKNGMKFLILSKRILQEAFKNTIYEPVLKLYEAPTATVVSKESDFQKLLKNLKKIPKLILMGALIENRLLSASQFKALGRYNDITEARLELASVLNSIPQNLLLKLNYNPITLVELLNQRKKLLKESNSKS